MTKQSKGFTVIEMIFIATLIAFASIFFFIQKNNLEITANDNTRKSAINAMYYSLEEVFYPANKFYPTTISSDNLKSMDPELFSDTDGKMINTSGSAYTYKPTDCVNDKCKGYTLKTTLLNEADFEKTNKN